MRIGLWTGRILRETEWEYFWDADCWKDKLKQTIQTNKQKIKTQNPKLAYVCKSLGGLSYNEGEKEKKKEKKEGEILKLYLIEFHTTKTLTTDPNCECERHPQLPIGSTLPPRASYKNHQGKKSHDDATTSYLKFQLHHSIPISSMYSMYLADLRSSFGFILWGHVNTCQDLFLIPASIHRQQFFQAPRCDDGAQKKVDELSFWWWVPPRSLKVRTFGLQFTQGSVSKGSQNSSTSTRFMLRSLPRKHIASNEIKAHWRNFSWRNFWRLLFKSVEWMKGMESHRIEGPWVDMDGISWVVPSWNVRIWNILCLHTVPLVYIHITELNSGFLLWHPVFWGIIWNLGFGWAFLPAFDILCI